MFIPSSLSVTAGVPVLDRSTVTELTVADATVTVASAVTAVGVALVTVRTYVVVAVGLTLTPTPLVAVRLPGVITPVPFANTAVRVALDPVVMVPEFAVKLVIAGAAFTVTVAGAVTAVPLVGVTVSVYVVVAVGLTFTATPLVAGRLPGVITPVPFAKTPVRAALVPFVMEVGFAVKLLIEGGGGGGGVLDDPPPQPVKLARPRLRVIASRVRIRRRFIGFPVFRTREVLIRTAASATALFSE
jgi:hypothetical protein